jgi:N-acetyl-anhydromuramoyl-L-alanine amidase
MHGRPLDVLPGARQRRSPNWDARPRGARVELIVIHGISLPPGQFGGPFIDQLFTNRLSPHAHPYFVEVAGLRVSAHLLIRRNGRIVQYVPFTGRAWHAGQSRLRRRSGCNDFSIGIELEGTDDLRYTAAQYRSLAACVATLIRAYPRLSPQRIVGHSDVAPGRKSDPGASFDWARFRALLGHARAARAYAAGRAR